MPDQILLHVEDDDVAASLLEMLLNESGAWLRLFRLTDGEEALAFLHQTGEHAGAPRPDLMLLDLGLPFRSGFEVLEEMREDARLQSLPVVVFSSSGLPSDRERALELGALDFITKRPSVQGMRDAVQQIRSYLPKQFT
jgi:two-component system, chemotaxis family, response regulator Rcp1